MLSLLNIISLILVCWIQLKLFPLIEVSNERFDVNGINNIVLTLSYGIITSTIFYIIVVLIPNQKRKKTTKLVIQRHINLITDKLTVIFLYLYKKNNNKIEELHIEKFSISTFGKTVIYPN